MNKAKTKKTNDCEIVREIMKRKGFTFKTLADKLGYPNHSSVSEKLRVGSSQRTDTLVAFLEAMDCELVIRSKLRDDIGEMVVTVTNIDGGEEG